MSRLVRLRAPLKRILRDQSGAVTVEMVIWMPFIFVVLYMIADVSLVFHRQSEILRQVQANNRAFATGRISRAEVASNIKAAIRGFAPDADVDTDFDTVVRTITTTVTVDAEDMMAVGAFGLLGGQEMTITASHLTEV